MKQITIGFSKANTSFPIFSWLILWALKTPYSHVYLKYHDDYTSRVVYYQASHTLVNYMGQATFLSQETVIQEFVFNVSDANFLAIQQFAIDNAGKPYGVLEIIGLAMVIACAKVGIKVNNPFKDAGSTWICDQLVAGILNSCDGVNLPVGLNNMTPLDAFNLVKTLPTNLS
jgi:hypothetical protein